MHSLSIRIVQVDRNTGELLYTTIMVKMAVSNQDDQRLVGQFPDSFRQMADTAAGIDEGSFFFALHQESIDQLELTEAPGLRSKLRNFVSVHDYYCSI